MKILLEKSLDHEFRGVVAGSTNFLNSINSHKYFRGLSSLRMMKEITGFTPMSFVFHRGSYFIEPYNEVISRLRDAGITEYWINYDRRKNEKIEHLGPQVLDMDHLEVCFYVCMFPLIFALLAFFGEFSAELVKFICKSLRDKIASFCKRISTRHRIIQVRPIGYERRKTKREKISSAFESLCKSVKSEVKKRRVKLPKQPKPKKFKLSPQKTSPKRLKKLKTKVEVFFVGTKENL
jgi:hypothetical protein